MWKILCATRDDQVRSEFEKLGQQTSFYQVQCVSNADEMFWSAVTETFDAYVLDTGLRPESATDLCRAIRAADENGGIVCMSRVEDDRFRALDAGADLFLKLPGELHLLRLRIEDLFDTVTTKAS